MDDPGRPTITPTLADLIGQRVQAGEDKATLAREYRLSEWVVALICAARPTCEKTATDKTARAETALDPDDLARIYRRMAAGQSARHIASELGVSRRTVARLKLRRALIHRMATGQSLADAAVAMHLSFDEAKRLKNSEPRLAAVAVGKHERRVIRPTLCPHCGAPLAVLPCRACSIRAQIDAR